MTLLNISTFTRKQEGSISIFGLFMVIACIIIAGLGLDVMNAMTTRTKLQVAADSAAHAALMTRQDFSEAEAKAIGVAVAQIALPPSKYGTTITADDIQFGTWDTTTDQFTPQAGVDDAVLVSTANLSARGNPMGTYFLKFIGMGSMDVVSQSVFETYVPTCFREGFVAEQTVDVQSNNTYGNGFCIHSNDHVEINNGNSFLDGTIVSMPDSRDLVIPTDGMDSNPGLDDALRDGAYRLRLLDRIDEAIDYVDDPTSVYFRSDYVDIDPLTGLPPARVTLDRRDSLTAGVWVSGAIHEVDCTAPNQSVRIPANEIITKGILITNCQVVFGANSEIRDVMIITTNTADDSISGASGATIGRDDGCSPGGGAQLVTKGGMNFPSDLQIYGGQLIAAKSINFAARPDGIEGVSIVAGGMIDGSSLINVGFCGGAGMENNFFAWYFRMAT